MNHAQPSMNKHECAIVRQRFSFIVTSPGACFSKVPVTSGPDNLSGRLSENFIGPEVAFLEAPVNFPGTYRARGPFLERPGKLSGPVSGPLSPR